jgi:GTP 3',8-cyclase
MPEQVTFLPRALLLSFEEIERFVRIAVTLGIDKVRLTGGEPLVRRGLTTLVEKLTAIPGLIDVGLTTNGILLAPLARMLRDAGLKRINISLDTMDPSKFERLTRRPGLEQVIAGILAAKEAGFEPVKINAIAIRGETEDEVVPLAQFARQHGLELRFIEYMPLDADHAWSTEQVLTGAEARAAIDAVYPLEPEPRERSATARVYRFAEGRGRIGFINPVSEPFCADCNRIRLTADGRLRTCLFSLNETDLRGPIRDGASDDELEQIIRDAVWRKELKHHIGEPGFIQPARTMSAIGG